MTVSNLSVFLVPYSRNEDSSSEDTVRILQRLYHTNTVEKMDCAESKLLSLGRESHSVVYI